jgi:hypothetical protein
MAPQKLELIITNTYLISTARIRRLGIRNLQADDYLMLSAVIWYTLLCVALNQVASGGGSNLMTQEDIDTLTPAIHAEREKGSKWVFVSEHAFVLAVWSMKACMLVIYARITEGLRQRKWINYIAIYVVLGFVATELSLFLICRPITNYWAVPTPNCKEASLQCPRSPSINKLQTNVPRTSIMRSFKDAFLSPPMFLCFLSPFLYSYKFVYQ